MTDLLTAPVSVIYAPMGLEKALIPACAESCPSGAIVFGERDELINLAVSRVEELRKSGLPRADIYGLTELGGLKTLYILGEGKRIARVHMLCRKIRSSPLPPEPGAYYLSHYVLSCRWPFYLPCGLIKMNSVEKE